MRVKRLKNVLIYLGIELGMEQMLGYLRRCPREEFLNGGGDMGFLKGGRHSGGQFFDIVKFGLTE